MTMKMFLPIFSLWEASQLLALSLHFLLQPAKQHSTDLKQSGPFFIA